MLRLSFGEAHERAARTDRTTGPALGIHSD
jgi:hypothetical protein